VTDTPNNGPRVSRRMWLAGLGGGLLSAPFLWWFDVPRRPRRDIATGDLEQSCCAYVDRDGWMLTPSDAAALAARPAVQ
jgi:hypothetical protein